MMAVYPPPGAYKIVVHHKRSPEWAAADVFPDCASVVLVETERVGATVAYTFMVDYLGGDDEALQPPA